MNLDKNRFSNLIRGFQLRELFNELGWDNVKKKEYVAEADNKFELEAVAEKREFVIFLCSSDKSGKIPNQNIRRKIDNRISKLFFEHLIIYTDLNKSQQIWQLVIREPNKPIIPREFVYYTTQFPELLLQKLSGLFFSIDDEEKISLPDVKARIQAQFNNNAEKVTKKFYERFQKELVSFQKFIEGIEDIVDKEWYSSLMMNRLMFIYFIQKKGFLDKNVNYLYDKLKLTQKAKGKNKFYSFYKDFLLVLFHDGLGSPKRTKQLEEDLGKIPYLNGGLFEVHQLEERNKKINIDDKAFERIFDFFDEYNWHLDNSPTSTGRDINPDVIGYIFEKYINDRASMGAYYTKEDITEYIGKNTIIPFLYDEVKKECANAFRDDSSLWKMLRDNPDRYIYEAVKHGIYEDFVIEEPKQFKIRALPSEIQKGINPEIEKRLVKDVEDNPPQLLELRKEWNKPAPAEYALPTEIWREVVERRNRYFDIRNKIVSGEIKEINDFITYNLDIRQFAQDSVEQYEGSDFINAFYKAITKISILDPTCGSGAFLFAALNILEPLYEACLSRMREFIEVDESTSGKKHPAFRNVIKEINHHPNEKYFIFKSIILKNLFGVDIMKEATEIAKLRLFLKLVAEVEVDYKKDNLGLEPLPDIDFNIRSGNTLIGFAKFEDVEKVLEGEFGFSDEKKLIDKIKEEAELVSMAFQRYKDSQLIIEKNGELHNKAKQELNNRLKSLNDKLNIYQASLYGIDTKKKKEYEAWKSSHQPFHWFAEFYEIINADGFDVIIGNPPYVEYKDIKDSYTLRNYSCIDSGDLYAFVIERAFNISITDGRSGYIIPMSCFTVDGFASIQELFYRLVKTLYVSNWSGDAHPARMFEGVDKRLHITICKKRNQLNQNLSSQIYVTHYLKWYSDERDNLFNTRLNYYLLRRDKDSFFEHSLVKLNSLVEVGIIEKLQKQKSLAYRLSNNTSEHVIYYTRKVSFFLQFLGFIPIVKDFNKKLREPSELKQLYFVDENKKVAALASLSSSIFYWYYIINSDCRNLNKREIVSFNVPSIDDQKILPLTIILNGLMDDYKTNSTMRTVCYKNKGDITVQYFNFRLSKSIIDEIDYILAEHYGFTEEELDFIINYDIKYRMGKELEEE